MFLNIINTTMMFSNLILEQSLTDTWNPCHVFATVFFKAFSPLLDVRRRRRSLVLRVSYSMQMFNTHSIIYSLVTSFISREAKTHKKASKKYILLQM